MHHLTYTSKTGCPVMVFLCATHYTIGLHNAIISLQTYDYSYKVLGFAQHWEGFQTKMKEYLTACRRHAERFGPRSLVVCMDAYDAVCARHWSGITSLFHQLFGSKRILACMETTRGHPNNCTSLDLWLAELQESGTIASDSIPENRYVNSGLIMGECGAIADMFDWMLSEHYEDDQLGMGSYMNHNPKVFGGDFNNDILFTVDRQKIDDATVNGKGSYFVHVPKIYNYLSKARQYDAITNQISPFCLRLHHFNSMHIWMAIAVLVVIVMLTIALIKTFMSRSQWKKKYEEMITNKEIVT